MTKQRLKEFVDNNDQALMRVGLFTQLQRLVNQLDEPTPERIPFTWPIPDGFKAVTRDGREVTQLVKFETSDTFPFHGVIGTSMNGWRDDGKIGKIDHDHDLDLFLQHIAPEMVEAWYCPFTTIGITLNEKVAINWEKDGNNVYPISFRKPKI